MRFATLEICSCLFRHVFCKQFADTDHEIVLYLSPGGLTGMVAKATLQAYDLVANMAPRCDLSISSARNLILQLTRDSLQPASDGLPT